MALDAFLPQGNSQLISATTTPSAAIQASTGGIQGVRIRSSAVAFVSISKTSSDTVSIPTTSTPANGIPLIATVFEKFSVPPNAWLSFMTSGASGALIYVTPGIGL
jgi:hypothetical protein